jgi:hypothetical protein
MPRFILPMLATFAFLAISFAANAQDIAEIRARQKIAVQKLTGEVDKAIQDSRKLDPADAVNMLKRLEREVKDRDMVAADRDPLLARLRTRINQLSEVERGAKVAQDQKPLAQRPRFDPPSKSGGGNPYADGGRAGFAKDFIGSAKGAQTSAADNIRNREKGMLATARDYERVLPMDGEINFPKNWKAISERRKEMVNPKLTAQEVKLLKTLNSTMSVSYDNDKFRAVINHLQDRTGLGIIIDEGSLRDANVDYDDPVTFKVEKASVRTILKKVLGDNRLTYIIKEGNIQVMTPKRASEYTVVRSYPISDLITPIQANVMFPPFMQQFQKQQNAQQIINLIVFSTGVDYWQPNGPGNITYFMPTDSLLIRASAEMHYQLASPGLFGR